MKGVYVIEELYDDVFGCIFVIVNFDGNFIWVSFVD